ncbi:MAG: RsmD family RNA methyltransferase, partial [Acidobacteriota bacterium]|nr:RsmD family RNA methyltransferase [Acidobacteriota bacterium]
MGRIRIIAGELRGRRIEVPEGLGVRPTPDRVREALFSSLGPDLTALRVLDAYAGSGALGFEALSRGAAHVTMIESDPKTLTVLARNVA